MVIRKKLREWDGFRKARVRGYKKSLIRQARRDGLLPENCSALTFAGAQARLEKDLVREELFNPSNIVTIQWDKDKEARAVLNYLVKLRDQELPGMFIWPTSFQKFCRGLKQGRIYTPTVSPSSQPSWFRSPTFKKEMYRFHDLGPKKFGLLDLDFCGVFSQESAENISTLFKQGMVADKGLLFINYQEGRDGKMMSYVRDYFHNCELFDVTRIPNLDGNLIDFNQKKPTVENLHPVRYSLVPMIHVLEAYKAGFHMDVDCLIRYKDVNDTNLGVHMLQWCFSFRRTRSSKLTANKDFSTSMMLQSEYVKHLSKERELLNYPLDVLSNERYRLHRTCGCTDWCY